MSLRSWLRHLVRFRPAHRVQVLDQFTTLDPLQEPELAAKMRTRAYRVEVRPKAQSFEEWKARYDNEERCA